MRAQEKNKRQVDRGKKKAEVQKVRDKVMLSTKDLKQPARKLVD